MAFKKISFLAMTLLMSTDVYAATLSMKTENLTANIKSQATLSAQWVPSTIYGTRNARNSNIGVLTISSSHLNKISISSTEHNPRTGIITFYKKAPNTNEWLIVGIKPLSGVDFSPILSGFTLTPSNGQANFSSSLPLQLYAEYVSGGGGANGNNISNGEYEATVNITTEVG